MVFVEKSEGHWIPTDFKEYYIVLGVLVVNER